ncbi:MAG: zinc ribbon domain-containing protein [Caldilineaceae bacterium]|nr:zinc ribbon domain-containing protein [Caldilinea sp.]MCB0133699.1 zinc ribbon domain-containing protein [Caldilineaceae bacterium]
MADEQQVCPNCGNFNRAGARFCSKCGHVFKPLAVAAVPAAPAKAPTPPPKTSATPAPAPGTILCPSCGREVSSDTRFCRHCGNPLGTAQPVTSPTATDSPAPGATRQAAPVASSSATPNMQAAADDDDVTRPLSVKRVPSQPVTPAGATAHSAPGVERGAPAWLWALVGLLIGILLGAGIVLAAPGFVGLARIDAPGAATPAVTPPTTDAATPLDLPTATAEVVATATPEPSPAAAATATTTPAAVATNAAPPDDAAASSTTAADPATAVSPGEAEALPAEVTEAATAPANAAAPEDLFTSTPLAP